MKRAVETMIELWNHADTYIRTYIHTPTLIACIRSRKLRVSPMGNVPNTKIPNIPELDVSMGCRAKKLICYQTKHTHTLFGDLDPAIAHIPLMAQCVWIYYIRSN